MLAIRKRLAVVTGSPVAGSATPYAASWTSRPSFATAMETAMAPLLINGGAIRSSNTCQSTPSSTPGPSAVTTGESSGMVLSVAGVVVVGTAPASSSPDPDPDPVLDPDPDPVLDPDPALRDGATGDGVTGDGDAVVGCVVNVPVVIAGVALPNAPLPNAAATASPSTIAGSATGVR